MLGGKPALRARRSCRLNAMNLDSGLSQRSSCQVMSWL